MERRGRASSTSLARRGETRLDESPTTAKRNANSSGAERDERHRIAGFEKLSQLRQRLGQKAEQEPRFRFYTLWDRIYRMDTLEAAYQQVSRNGGAPGIDGVTIEQIEGTENGKEALLEEIQEELRTKRYKPQPVRRVNIPKPDGRTRPLGIPTVKDRVIQTATLLILEPIFEADFEPCSYGFRPGRSAHQALEEIRGHLRDGYQAVYDADLKGYFDSIPHDQLMKCIQMRISDRMVLKVIRMWLKAVVVEPRPGGGGKLRAGRAKKGTPQGGVISPLLANIYLHWFDKVFHRADGPAQWADAKLVRYADDFVVMARDIGPQLTAFIEEKIEDWLGLEINREKTRVVNLREVGESLNFLGYTYRYDQDVHGRGYRYLHLGVSKKAMARERMRLRELTDRRWCYQPLPMMIDRLNVHLRGWANYFSMGQPRRYYRDINTYVRRRLEGHLGRRSQRPFRPPKGKSLYRHLQERGLVYL